MPVDELKEFHDVGSDRMKVHNSINELQRTVIEMVKSKSYSKEEMKAVLNNGIKALVIMDMNTMSIIPSMRDLLLDAIDGKYDKEISVLPD